MDFDQVARTIHALERTGAVKYQTAEERKPRRPVEKTIAPRLHGQEKCAEQADDGDQHMTLNCLIAEHKTQSCRAQDDRPV